MTIEKKEIPAELKGWNWGAFFLNVIWGIRFKTYRALWVFVPFVNLVMPFVLGLKGNEWAWQNNHWNSVEEFKKSQRRWSVASILIVGVSFVFLSLVQLNVFSSFKESEATKLALNTAEQAQSFQKNIGMPYEISFIKGTKHEVQTVDSVPEHELPPNTVHMLYDIEGQRGSGVIEFKASQKAGNSWRLTCIKLTYAPDQTVDILVPCKSD
ncbi:cytochrome c oxidase assembly factor Coa1 family protein [Pseudoalteromonas luteoviolacea]|uniref:cytochrome c oxidase assembly factor Coa1 family protein n=1 Tax=Pseudoalteromonas luteoviolacea TaxID=43657 RepID=UPI001B367EF1|nr:cytochrome c oxidase assembly factor Coa1 family protein [Pseudoalteromonas luteoviolacea]MBQ4834865.1 hypothetical protein [Pseudoalteromonas luteoviolacea]